MSDPTPSRSAGAVYPTRQQLDDLEALMERMLALPVSKTEEETDGPAELVAAPEAAHATAVNGHSLRTVTRPVPEAPPWFDNEPVADAILPPPDRLEKLEAEPQSVEPASEPARPVAPGELPRAAWPLRPLVWCNRLFDRWTFNLGSTGRWLRGSVGRNLVGVGGLFLLAGAVAWAILDWIGWTW